MAGGWKRNRIDNSSFLAEVYFLCMSRNAVAAMMISLINEQFTKEKPMNKPAQHNSDHIKK